MKDWSVLQQKLDDILPKLPSSEPAHARKSSNLDLPRIDPADVVTTSSDVKEVFNLFPPSQQQLHLKQQKQPIYKNPLIRNDSVEGILRSRLACIKEDDDPFYVADLGQVILQYQQWRELLPRVDPLYAMKCNPDRVILQTLLSLGVGFDCASKTELETALSVGADPSRIIFANPCKQPSHIRFAAHHNISMMTFDNADELEKVKRIHPNAQMVLRILTDDSKSLCQFGVKFGARMSLVPSLLQKAKDLGMNVIGISFHVGSGCFDASAFVDAVHLARKAFDVGAALGFDFKLLDIGGGFPGRNNNGLQFEEIAGLLGPAIDKLFPPEIRVIAEPGRYFVANAYTLAVNVVARRVVGRVTPPSENPTGSHETLLEQDDSGKSAEANSYMYYINDGQYGSFNCITFDHAVVKGQPLLHRGKFCYGVSRDLPLYPCSIWGPTCDSMDWISKDSVLPELFIGDWLYFTNMGAYTVAAASDFNGFLGPSVIYTNTLYNH